MTPEYVLYSADTKGYNTDFNNIAPNIGIAWRPNVQDGFLRKLLGDPELATINAGCTRSFNRERLDRFLTVYNGNPGQTIPATREHGTAAVPAGRCRASRWPILFSQKDRLGAPAFDPTPIFPVPATFANGAWVFNPDIEVPIHGLVERELPAFADEGHGGRIAVSGQHRAGSAWTLENWNADQHLRDGLADRPERRGHA